MERVLKGIGIVLILIGGCALDSEGQAYSVVLAIIGIGVALLAIGVVIDAIQHYLYERRKSRQRRFFNYDLSKEE